MTGDNLSVVLIGFYVVLACVYGYEGQWFKVLYWISAAGIVTAVWGMK
jgi:hypothetical protein